MSADQTPVEETPAVGAAFKILQREDFGSSFSGHCWVVVTRMPDGRVVVAHDPTEPSDYYACGQRQLCDEVRALYEEASHG